MRACLFIWHYLLDLFFVIQMRKFIHARLNRHIVHKEGSKRLQFDVNSTFQYFYLTPCGNLLEFVVVFSSPMHHLMLIYWFQTVTTSISFKNKEKSHFIMRWRWRWNQEREQKCLMLEWTIHEREYKIRLGSNIFSSDLHKFPSLSAFHRNSVTGSGEKMFEFIDDASP